MACECLLKKGIAYQRKVDLANICYFYPGTLSEKSHKHITYRKMSTQSLLLLE